MNNFLCRFCSTVLVQTFVDLGTAPLCQKHVTPARFSSAESVYPQHVFVCSECQLVQLPQYLAREEIFDHEYGYFSSYSESWLKHSENYVDMMIKRFNLGGFDRVVELASNDGYLLQYFRQRGILSLGIEPTKNTATVARKKGIETIEKFFGEETAREVRHHYGPAKVILGNNVLAHVPNINDFVSGIQILLDDSGVVTMEFPVLHKLIANNYFDTIYHEHFSYLSFTVVREIFGSHGIILFDVEELPTHGGSIRIFGRHAHNTTMPVEDSVYRMLRKEEGLGHYRSEYYARFSERVRESKRKILEWFIATKRAGKSIAAYGAPGKGNTLLNYCGIRTDFIDYTVDYNPHKQGNFLPGSRIPILHPDTVKETRPDYVVLLPWNLKDEISKKISYIRDWGGQCVVLLPEVQILP